MATKTYQGNDGNWATPATWVPVNEPIDGDVVIIPSDTTVNITAGLDNGGVKLDALIVAKGSVVKVGTTGGPLIIAATIVHYQGQGEFNYTHAANAGDAEVTDLVKIEPSLASANVQLNSEEKDALGMPQVMIDGGNVNILSNMGTMTNLAVTARTQKVTIQPGANALTNLFGSGSFIEAHNVITNVHLENGCTLTQETAAITNAFIAAGATLFYNDDGTITLVKVGPGGTFDLMQVGKEVTVTTGIWLPGSTINKDATIHTITNEYDLRMTA